jgi:streptogramin lyase
MTTNKQTSSKNNNSSSVIGAIKKVFASLLAISLIFVGIYGSLTLLDKDTPIAMADTLPLNVTINQASTQSDPTGVNVIHFTAVFSRSISVASFDANDVILTGTAPAPAITSITQLSPNDGTIFDITVVTAGSGTVIANIPQGISSYTPSTFAYSGSNPLGISSDSAGNIYTSNYSGGSLTKTTPSGSTAFTASTGVNPRGNILDPAGNIYTANFSTNTITKITPSGVSSTFASTGSGPTAIAFDPSGNLYVTNFVSNNVSKITPSGMSSILGTTDANPLDLILDQNGNVYVVNYGGNTVTKITPSGTSTVFATTGTTPYDIIMDPAGNFFVVNENSNNITKITPQGVSSTFATTGNRPVALVMDPSGNIYTANYGSSTVTKVTPTGVSSTIASTGSTPHGITIDQNDNLYTSNFNAGTITKITNTKTGIQDSAGILNSASTSVDNVITILDSGVIQGGSVNVDKKFIVGAAEKDNLLGADAVTPGGTITERIYYNNTGTTAGLDAQIQSQLPAGFTVNSLKNCIIPSGSESVCSGSLPVSSLVNGSNQLNVSPVAGLYDAVSAYSAGTVSGTSTTAAKGILEMGKKQSIQRSFCVVGYPNATGSIVDQTFTPNNGTLSGTPVCYAPNDPNTPLSSILGGTSSILPADHIWDNQYLVGKRYIQRAFCEITYPNGTISLADQTFTANNGTLAGTPACYAANNPNSPSAILLGGTTSFNTWYNMDMLGQRYIQRASCIISYPDGTQSIADQTFSPNNGNLGGFPLCYAANDFNTPLTNVFGGTATYHQWYNEDLLDSTRGRGYIEVSMTAPTSAVYPTQIFNQTAGLTGSNFTPSSDIGQIEVIGIPLNVTINQASTQSDPTGVNVIHFTAVFSRSISVASFDANDVILTGTAPGATVTSINQVSPNDGTTFEITVSTTGSGTVIANIPQGTYSYTPSTLAYSGSNPLGINIDSSGNIYTVNYSGNSLTKTTPSGSTAFTVSTGGNPRGVVLDSAGNIYVTSELTGTVTKVTPTGISSTFANVGAGPAGIAIDPAGNLYVANFAGNSVSKITPSGVSTIIGNTGSGTNPLDITLDQSGNVYTVNYSANTVSKITPLGVVTTFATTGTTPYDITIDPVGNLYVANQNSNNVTKITPSGTSTILGTTGNQPISIVLDSSGNVYTSNNTSNTVTKITPSGVSSTLATTGIGPHGITIDQNGNLYTSNFNAGTVTKIANTKTGIQDLAGTLNSASTSVDNVITILDSADLQLIKTSSGGSNSATITTGQVNQKTNIEYTLTITNLGPDTAAGPISIVDTYNSTKLQFATSTPPIGWTCGSPDLTIPTAAVITCQTSNTIINGGNVQIILNFLVL